VHRISAVLFDLDGVLVESAKATERAWLDWAATNGIDESALRSAMHGVRSADVIRALRPALDAAVESEWVERRQAEDTAGLRAVGIEPPAVMVFAGDVARGKPDPEGYLTAARRLGVEPAEALVVEDAPPGIEAGRAAGMATVAVTSTHSREELGAADAVLGSLAELPELLAARFDAAAVLERQH